MGPTNTDSEVLLALPAQTTFASYRPLLDSDQFKPVHAGGWI
jgi:hypothetical protein